MIAQEFRALLAAAGFLTRIPVPPALDGDDVRRSAAYFPLVGAGVGALTGLAARRVGPGWALAGQTVLTGALHLDALADSADALGTRDRERALEIMRDSRVGSFGTAAMCLDLLIKYAALTSLAAQPAPARSAAGAGALSRAVPMVLSAALPYARSSGTGQAFGNASSGRAALAAGLAVTISRNAGAIGLAAVVTGASAGFWRRKLGGVTGDALGAAVELTECAILSWNAR